MSIKKTVFVVVFLVFLFFEQSLESLSDKSSLYPDLTATEISARIDSSVHNFYENCSARVDSLFNKIIEENAPGCCVLVIQNSKIMHKRGYGLADLRTRQLIQPETRFMLASVSKQFTAMAIMILTEEGKISYEDTLPKFFHNVPQGWKTITIEHLLTHTSGLPDRFQLIGYAEGYKNQDILNRLIKHRLLNFTPGEKHKYSNSGYNLLSMIVEKVSGQPFREFLKERIFEPLEMHDTIVYDETEPAINNRAIAYRSSRSGYKPNDFLLYTTGSSGIFSNVEDLFKWDQSLYTEKLVSTETINKAFSSHSRISQREYYGYGWRIRPNTEVKVVYHTGSLGGICNIIFRIPEEQLTIIILSNTNIPRIRIVREIIKFYHPRLTNTLRF